MEEEKEEDEKENIKLIFNNSEKVLPKTPTSFSELKDLFFKFFPEVDKSINYNFVYKYSEETILISENNNFQNHIESIYETGNPIIYVEIEKNNIDNDDNVFDSGVKSLINEDNEKNEDSFNKEFGDPIFFNKKNLVESEAVNKIEDDNENNNKDKNLSKIELLEEELKLTKQKLEKER